MRELEVATEICKHPAKSRYTDLQTGEVACRKCGEVLPPQTTPIPGGDKFGRPPENFAVFRHNLGSTSKKSKSDHLERSHGHVLNCVYGKEAKRASIRPLNRIINSCPKCGKENALDVFINPVKCQNPKCGIELGQYVLRWLPFTPYDPKDNGTSNPANWRIADLQLLRAWDGPEEPFIKEAREIFSERLDGKISDEKADYLAKRFMKSVKQLVQIRKRDIETVLDLVLKVEGINIR